jgi:predicted nucleic acid-binding protein
MSVYVVDASVAVKWVVDEVGSEEAAALRGDELRAPDWLHAECTNVLWAKSRRKELTSEEAADRLAILLEAPLLLSSSRQLLDRALALALELAHPVYDCLYLALALECRCPLVTADERFVAAVRKSGLYDAEVRSLFDPPEADLVMESGR